MAMIEQMDMIEGLSNRRCLIRHSSDLFRLQAGTRKTLFK